MTTSITTQFVSTKDYITIFFDEPITIEKGNDYFNMIKEILETNIVEEYISEFESFNKKLSYKEKVKKCRMIFNDITSESIVMLIESIYEHYKSNNVKKVKDKMISDILKMIYKRKNSYSIFELYRSILTNSLKELCNKATFINKKFYGTGISVINGELYYYTKKLKQNNKLFRHILKYIKLKQNVDHYVKFLDNILNNPFKDIQEELFDFLSNGNFKIHEDGRFSAYKKISSDWKDIYTKTIDHSIGSKPKEINFDTNRENVCSNGLHFCAYDYLDKYHDSGSTRIVEVRINPKDVVAIPTDYNYMKGRCVTYEVIKEITKEGDILNIKEAAA